MRPVNLFLTEDGVLKLGYYGLTTQAECYSIKKTNCDGVRSFAPEVFEEEYEMESDMWSLGTTLLELMGIKPYYLYKNNRFHNVNGDFEWPFDVDAIESASLTDFVIKCFEERVRKRWSVIKLMNVSVMGGE